MVLVAATGGAALIVGGVSMGAGISGTINSVQQANNDKPEFSGASFATSIIVGGATSVLTAGASSAASGIASKFALEGGKKLAT